MPSDYLVFVHVRRERDAAYSNAYVGRIALREGVRSEPGTRLAATTLKAKGEECLKEPSRSVDFVEREKRHGIQTSYVVRSSNARAESCDRNGAGHTSPPPPWRISVCSRTSRNAAGRSQILRTRSPTNSARWREELRTWAQDEMIERLRPKGCNTPVFNSAARALSGSATNEE